MTGKALDVFISYSRRDEGLKDELVNYHLKLLQREGKINTWQDRDIEAGAEWAREIKANLEKADIVLLLITRHFLASDYCYETEMQRAVQRHHDGTAKVIPIIMETCGWQYSDFSQLQALPKGAKPVTRWADRAEAFFDVEEGIRRVVDALNAERHEAAEQARVEAERLRQQEAERLKQQQAAAERLERERKAEVERQEQERQAAEKRQREEAERLEQQARAEYLRQQQKAERLEQERQQREAAERQKQQQAEAERQARERQRQQAEERQRQREAAAARRRQQWQSVMGRRQALQIAGFGGGGLLLAIVTGSLLQADRSPETPQLPAVTGSSPDDLSTVDVQTVKVNDRGNITDRTQSQVNAFREDLGNGLGLDMIAIPAGEFVMGSPPEETGRDDDEGPQRTVTIPSFFMGRFQVTQAQYEVVMGQHVSRFQGADRPVETVSWEDTMAFCEKLSELTGRTYRLPSEAEWEYACRAETTTPFHFGPTITTDLANYDGNYTYGNGPKGTYRQQTTDVGSFPPNAFGLYDMHGNVWERCQDVWHENYEGAPTDGSAWLEGGDQSWRVLRGGSWFGSPDVCRSANRFRFPRDDILGNVGFRVVWVPA